LPSLHVMKSELQYDRSQPRSTPRQTHTHTQRQRHDRGQRQRPERRRRCRRRDRQTHTVMVKILASLKSCAERKRGRNVCREEKDLNPTYEAGCRGVELSSDIVSARLCPGFTVTIARTQKRNLCNSTGCEVCLRTEAFQRGPLSGRECLRASARSGWTTLPTGRFSQRSQRRFFFSSAPPHPTGLERKTFALAAAQRHKCRA
jgi:hypothetical protein